MDPARRIAMELLFLLPVVSLPMGSLMGWLGLNGQLMDSSYHDNVEGGLVWMLIGLLPPAMFAFLKYRDRSRKQPRGFPVVPKPSGPAVADNPPLERTGRER
jgi:hypothetical protein